MELFISGRKLKDLDAFSKSDPICSVSIYNDKNRRWELQGKTEQIHNNLNPDFHTSVHVLYSFEKVQKIRFDFIDVDNLGEYDTIGTVDTTIGEIMGSMA